LDITTLNGGNFGVPNSADPYSSFPVTLSMSDSAATRWLTAGSFGIDDHASAPLILDFQPVKISISGILMTLIFTPPRRQKLQ